MPLNSLLKALLALLVLHERGIRDAARCREHEATPLLLCHGVRAKRIDSHLKPEILEKTGRTALDRQFGLRARFSLQTRNCAGVERHGP